MQGSFPSPPYAHCKAKQDEYASDVRMPHEDIKLRAKKPFYRQGMMNYYVEWVAQDGF